MSDWNEQARTATSKAEFINLFCEGYKSLETLPVSKPMLIDMTFNSVLDFGCGIGRNFPYFSSISDKVYAYDLPHVMDKCEELRGKDLMSDIHVIRDMNNFDSRVDIIFSMFCFQHFNSVSHLSDVLHELSKISDHLYIVGRPFMEDKNSSNVFKEVQKSPFCHVVEESESDLSTKSGEGTYEMLLSTNPDTRLRSSSSVVFKSYSEAVADIKKWCSKIPFDISAVSGLPRSGCFIAGVISHFLNIPIIPFEHLIKGSTDYFRLNSSRPINVDDGHILIVDDTSWSGHTMEESKNIINKSSIKGIKFGSLYCSRSQSENLDTYYKIFDTFFHTFEWNLARDVVSQSFIFDMDGVICEDCTCDEDESEYLQFLKRAKPLYLPKFKINKICTGRLERYRLPTEAWLSRHNVEYGELCMMPCKTKEDRIKVGFGRWKALKSIEDTHAKLFVESDLSQAVEINDISKKPVLCVDNMRLYE